MTPAPAADALGQGRHAVTTYLLIAALFVTLALAAACSWAETAFFSLGSVRLRRMKLQRAPAAATVRALLARPRRLLVTVIIGNTLALAVASAVAATLGARWDERYGAAVAAAVMTALVFVFAEATPKTAGVSWPERGVTYTAALIRFLHVLFYPLNRAVAALTSYVVSRPSALNLELAPLSVEGLLQESEERGVLDDTEKEMVSRVVALRTTTAGEIATPRTRVFALPCDMSYDEAVRRVADVPFGRIPVYRGDVENIEGVLYVKDLLLAAAKPPRAAGEMARRAHFVPESRRALDLLLDFVRYRTHIAVVVDEYGAFHGVVTMNDVLSEIAGAPPQPIRATSAGQWVVAAEVEIDAFNDVTGARLHDDEAETVGGYLINRLGRIPQPGEEFRDADVTFTVLAAQPNRLIRVLAARSEDGR